MRELKYDALIKNITSDDLAICVHARVEILFISWGIAADALAIRVHARVEIQKTIL